MLVSNFCRSIGQLQSCFVISLSLQKNTRIIPRLGHDHILPNLFEFITHCFLPHSVQFTNHCTVRHSLYTDCRKVTHRNLYHIFISTVKGGLSHRCSEELRVGRLRIRSSILARDKKLFYPTKPLERVWSSTSLLVSKYHGLFPRV